MGTRTYDTIVAKWRERHDDYKRVGAMVSGAAIAEEVLADLRAVAEADDDEVLTLAEAAHRSGYSADHLRRLVRERKIPNAGRRHSPRIRRGDLPRKLGAGAQELAPRKPALVLPLVRPMQHTPDATRADLVRAVVNGAP